jgi:predicted nucleic acid-binding protein
LTPIAYIDTSALAKWYIAEPKSEEFTDWILVQDNPCVSSLTYTEFRCLLARKLRAEQLDTSLVQRIFAQFEQDIQDTHLVLFPVSDAHIRNARLLIDSLPDIPLRTLDALHLSTARDIPAAILASADKVMLNAAEALGFEIVSFA